MKIGLIIQREYFTRVKKKSFLLLTILIPLVFIGIGAGAGFLMANSSSKNLVLISDHTGMFNEKLHNSSDLTFVYGLTNVDSLKKNIDSMAYDAFIDIPKVNINQSQVLNIYSKSDLGAGPLMDIQSQLNDVLKSQAFAASGIDEAKIKQINASQINLNAKVGKSAESKNNMVSGALGYVCGFVLYFMLLFYGGNVMRSVMEEKTNRIAEIVVSSVKPWELMFGKIIGVGLVGITQLLIWGLLLFILSKLGINALQNRLGSDGMSDNLAILSAVKTVNWGKIITGFVFYFLGGYFLYASLYAAVGSLVNDDQQDAQQFTMIITIPIILAFVILNAAIKDPNSSVAVFGSIFPFTSPIIMMARLSYSVPAWQVILSGGLLIITFLGVAFLTGKIYRTGILMYGKKFTLKEVSKWLFKKG